MSGSALTLAYIDVGDLTGTAYGKRLLVKLGVVAAVLVIAAYHRFRVVPRLAGHASGLGHRTMFALSIVAEIALMALIVVITVLLVEVLP